MNRQSSRALATAAAAAGCALFSGPIYAEGAKQRAPIAACEKAVSILGASMGHKEITVGNGFAAYLFLVRANGFDYEVTCDATTGVVSDVTPRQG